MDRQQFFSHLETIAKARGQDKFRMLQEDLDALYAYAFGPNLAEFLRITEPRRYHQPGGYFGLRHYSRKLRTALATGTIAVGKKDKMAPPDLWDYATANILLKHNLPIYFVGRTLLTSLMKTEPPDNMLMTQLRFPMRALTFMLPEKFMVAPSGSPLTQISYARHDNGEVIQASPLFPKIDMSYEEMDIERGFLYNAVTNEGETYSGWIPITAKRNLAELLTYIGERFRYSPSATELPGDKEFGDVCVGLILRLIMVMGARPLLITAGRRTSKPSAQQDGRTEVWSPNWIGEKYQAPRAPSMGGTHTSPDLHWRIGHWRNQQYGPRKGLDPALWTHELIWIEPMTVGGGA